MSFAAHLSSQTIEPSVSLALLHHNQLVGWLIVDRTDQTSVRYSALFVAPSHRRRGQALHLLVAAVRRQHSQSIPIVRAAVAPSSEAILRLTKRHLHQHLNSVSRSLRSALALASPSVSAPTNSDS